MLILKLQESKNNATWEKKWVITNLGEVKPVVEERAVKTQEGINEKSV